MKTTERILVALAISVIGTASAAADSLPGPSVENNQCGYDASGGFVDGALSCAAIGSSAQISLAPFAGDTAEASAGFGVQSNALAQFAYYFEVTGGTPGTEVPLIITANLETSATAHGIGEAILDVSTNGGDLVSQAACTNVSVCLQGANFFGNITTTAMQGQLNSLELEAEAGVGFSVDAENASASADPMIMVDPTFANASAYSIILSPGVANSVASSPEPSTNLLIGAAFLVAFGRVLRRRRAASGV